MKKMGTERLAALLCVAALLIGLVGCGSASSAPDSRAEASVPASEVLPSGSGDTTTAPSSGASSGASSSSGPDNSTNSLKSLTDPDEALEACLGWGPGTAGSSLQSMAAAVSMLDWASENSLADNDADKLTDTLEDWYGGLNTVQQENISESWPMVVEQAELLLAEGPDELAELLDDAGIDAAALPDYADADWQALNEAMEEVVPAAIY